MDAVEILRKVAEYPVWGVLFSGTRCLHCGATYPEGPGDDDYDPDGWMLDENNHDEGCPYRLAKEYLANLDNEGYGG